VNDLLFDCFLFLYLFRGGVINDFAYTFLVGILTGTYSSIYIASALVLWWHKGKRPAIAAAPGVREMSIPMENPIPVPAPVALPWR